MIILLACFPKSGSTFVSSLFGRLPGFTKVGFAPDGERREQEIDISMASSYADRNCIVQQHVRASRWTKNCITWLDMRPIVLVRDIHDALVSLSDHMTNESIEMPFAYFDESFVNLDETKRLDAIIDLAAPWYFNFYVSWFKYRPDSIITYESTVLAGADGVDRIFRMADINIPLAEIGMLIRATDPKTVRFNNGTAGRGKSALNSKQKDRLRMLASYYEGVDFSPIGISKQ